jgi:hypothetical protein
MTYEDIQENIDFKFIVDDSIVTIELLDEKYSGVKYQYGKVEFDEDEENDQCYLNFNYDVVDSNGLELDNDDEFKNYIGTILVSCVSKYATGVLNENRTDDSKESNLQ